MDYNRGHYLFETEYLVQIKDNEFLRSNYDNIEAKINRLTFPLKNIGNFVYELGVLVMIKVSDNFETTEFGVIEKGRRKGGENYSYRKTVRIEILPNISPEVNPLKKIIVLLEGEGFKERSLKQLFLFFF